MNYANICDSLRFVCIVLSFGLARKLMEPNERKKNTQRAKHKRVCLLSSCQRLLLWCSRDFRLISQIKSTLTKLAGISFVEWWRGKRKIWRCIRNIKVKSFFIFGCTQKLLLSFTSCEFSFHFRLNIIVIFI